MKKPDYRDTKRKIEDLKEKHNVRHGQAVATVRRDELRDEINRIEDIHDVKQLLLQAFPPMTLSNDY